MAKLRKALERLAGEPEGTTSLLLQSLEPYPDGWRASVQRPNILPTTPWCCIAADSPTGADYARRRQDRRRHLTG